MIINPTPSLARIVREVHRPLIALFVWDVIVTVTYYVLPFRAPSLPLTLFGSGLALFLGLRDNAAYARWWEGRVLWGAMINASRSLSRATLSMIQGEDEQGISLRRAIILRQTAYVNALRCQLRRQDPKPEVLRFLSIEEAAEPLKFTNVANGLLNGTGARVGAALNQGRIDTIQQAQLEQVLIDIANAQGGMERIKNTPLPMQYRFFPAFFTRLFCVLLPIGLVETLGWATPVGSTLAGLMFLAVLAIGDDLVDPFANSVHDVPLNAMCRTIEIDLLQAIGDTPEPPVEQVRGVLW